MKVRKYWAVKIRTETKKHIYYTDFKTGTKHDMIIAFNNFKGGDLLNYKLNSEISYCDTEIILEERDKNTDEVLKVLFKKIFKMGKIVEY